MKSSIEIIPAVLPKNFTDLATKLERVAGVSRVAQVDIVDGVYAPNTTWPYGDSETFERILAGDEGLPHWAGLDFEFDLMVSDPSAQVERYVSAGAARIIVHAKSPSAFEAIEKLQPFRTNDELAVSVGLALSVDARPEEVEPFQTYIDYLQVMGIEDVGFQGRPFDPRATALVAQLSQRYPGLLIQVDGGVTLENIRELVAAGATRLVCGSAVFGSDDPVVAYQLLEREASRGL